jgi:hypothetical protein
MVLIESGWEDVEWMHLAQERDQWRALVNMVMNLRVRIEDGRKIRGRNMPLSVILERKNKKRNAKCVTIYRQRPWTIALMTTELQATAV